MSRHAGRKGPPKVVLACDSSELALCGKKAHPPEPAIASNDVKCSRVRVRGPQTNGFVERFHRTVLDAFFTEAFLSSFQVGYTTATTNTRTSAVGTRQNALPTPFTSPSIRSTRSPVISHPFSRVSGTLPGATPTAALKAATGLECPSSPESRKSMPSIDS